MTYVDSRTVGEGSDLGSIRLSSDDWRPHPSADKYVHVHVFMYCTCT